MLALAVQYLTGVPSKGRVAKGFAQMLFEVNNAIAQEVSLHFDVQAVVMPSTDPCTGDEGGKVFLRVPKISAEKIVQYYSNNMNVVRHQVPLPCAGGYLYRGDEDSAGARIVRCAVGEDYAILYIGVMWCKEPL